MPTPDKALHDLVVAHLTIEQLRRLLDHHYGPGILSELPSGTATLSNFAFEAMAELRRRRLIAAPLFAALVTEVPAAHADICVVAELFGVPAPPEPPPGSPLPPRSTPSTPPGGSSTVNIALEFVRSTNPGHPHTFEFRPQTYALRNSGAGFEQADFPWTTELLGDLRRVRMPDCPADTLHRLGGILRTFLAGAGWNIHENTIAVAVNADRPIYLTIRSAAAELYAVPWEFLVLKASGQFLGSIPGLLTRYEWPATASMPDRMSANRQGRVLFAWSAAGGAVPADKHMAALKAAFQDIHGGFEPDRDILPHTTLAGLHRALESAASRGEPIDALHLLCHGGPAGATYGLVLDDASSPGDRATVDAGRLQQVLARHAGMLRMVVVAACDSGNVGDLGNHLGSVAQMLHRIGIPVVVGSRFPLSTAGSTQFTTALYSALVRDRASLEQAFLAARDALSLDPTHRDWASMQLYSRENDGLATFPLSLEPPAGIPAVSARR